MRELADLTRLLREPEQPRRTATGGPPRGWLSAGELGAVFGRGGAERTFVICEGSNVDLVQRFGADTDCFGMRPFCWFSLEGHVGTLTSEDTASAMTNHPETEEHVEWLADGVFSVVAADAPLPNAEAALRCLSFDIEANPENEDGTETGFPKAETHRVLTIGAVLGGVFDLTYDRKAAQFDTDNLQRVVFQLGDVGSQQLVDHNERPIEVHTFPEDSPGESDMLLAFARLVEAYAPHAFFSWNGNGFDWPYLLERAVVLGCGAQFAGLCSRGRKLAADRLRVRETVFNTKASGKITKANVDAPGRVSFDMLAWFKAEKKEQSLKLGAVAEAHLRMTKEVCVCVCVCVIAFPSC